MKKLFTIIFLFCCLKSIGFAQESKLISFEIKDQFDRIYTEESFKDSIIILIGSDKDGSEYNGLWAQAIVDSLKNKKGFEYIKIVPQADMSVVPAFMRAVVKLMLPKEKHKWFLVDWEGVFPKT